MNDRSEKSLYNRLITIAKLGKEIEFFPEFHDIKKPNNERKTVQTQLIIDGIAEEVISIPWNILSFILENQPQIIERDIEEILSLREDVERLRADVARLRARVRWLSKCAFKDTNRCAKLPGFYRCVWNCGEWCGAADDLRKGCWREAADMATRENPGNSGNVTESEGEE